MEKNSSEEEEDICEVKSQPKYKCCRYFVVVINSIVLFIGLLSFLVGLIFRFSNMTDRVIGSFDSQFLCLTQPDLTEETVVPLLYCNSREELNIFFAGMITFGYVVTVVSVVGIMGAQVENIFVLRLFAFLVTLILLAEVILTVFILGRPAEVKASVMGFVGSVLADILNRTVEHQADVALAKELNTSGINMPTVVDFCDFLKTRAPGYEGPKSNFSVKVVINGQFELPVSAAQTEEFIRSKYGDLASGVHNQTDCQGKKWLKEAFAGQIRQQLCQIAGSIQTSLNCCGLESTGLMAELDEVYRCPDADLSCTAAQKASGTCRDAVWTTGMSLGAKMVWPIVGSAAALVAFAQLLTVCSGLLLAQMILRYRRAGCDQLDDITYVANGAKVTLSVAYKS